MSITIRLVGGPTAILEYGGVRWLTDPALSPPGQYGELVKTRGPAVAVDVVRAIATARGADRVRGAAHRRGAAPRSPATDPGETAVFDA